MLLKDYSASNYRRPKFLSNAILNWLVNWGILVVNQKNYNSLVNVNFTLKAKGLKQLAKFMPQEFP